MARARKLSRREFLLSGAGLVASRLWLPAWQQQFERHKPQVNLVVIGHPDHGLTELTAAMTHVLSLEGRAIARSVDEISEALETDEFNISLVEYETAERYYAQANFLTHSNALKNLIAGVVQADGAIMVVSALDGPMPQTRQQIQLAGQIGVPALVVFLNNVDQLDDEELLELEIREILTSYSFSADTPIIRGSASPAFESPNNDPDATEYAPIQELLDALDAWIPTPPRDEDLSFLMPIEDMFSIKGRGTVVTGYVERGQVSRGQDVEIIGLREETLATIVTGISMFNKELDSASAGDNVGILLRGIPREEIERGMVLAAPNSIRPYMRFGGEIYVLLSEEGGRHKAFFTGYRPQFYMRTTDVTGTITLPDGVEMVMPGDTTHIEVELISPVALEQGTRFAIREGGLTIGVGVVTELIE
jgi:elongation factor Tu